MSEDNVINGNFTHAAKLTPAQLSLKDLNDAIAQTDPKLQMEIKYVEERLHFLLNRYGDAAVYALMRANLQVTVQAGK